MSPEDFVGVAAITLDEVRKAEAAGAATERTRIRLALKPIVGELLKDARERASKWTELVALAIDAATRAPKKGRGR